MEQDVVPKGNEISPRKRVSSQEAAPAHDEILEGLTSYWNERSVTYSEQNVEEMNNWKRDAWRNLILKYAPEGECLDILDVGTGPGFFAMNLALAGHRVTAVDVTDEMLTHARQNAAAYGALVDFRKQRGEFLDFPDHSFDLIVNRNVIWNLEYPERALAEWQRVLKPGGRMVYFDANWYIYLFDEEVRKKHEAIHEEYKVRYPDHPHDKMLKHRVQELQEIARKLPLTPVQRPAWDQEILTGMGMKICEIIPDISPYCLDEIETFHYGATPMFMVCAEKTE